MQGFLLPVLMFGALGLMMFFGMRKQKRQAAEAQKLQDSIAVGARIMTTSGLHGTVTAVADDTIELEIAPEVYTTWVRAAVREVVVPAISEDEDDELLESDEYDDDYADEYDEDYVDGEAVDELDDESDDAFDGEAVEADEGDTRQSDVR